MRILSWNVNGLRAAVDKGFTAWLSRSRAHVVALQEVRARPEQLPDHVREGARSRLRHRVFSVAERPGYSGVALFSREPPDQLDTSLGVRSFDAEGRYQRAAFGSLVVVNAYFPNGAGRDRDNSRIPYKLEFYDKVFESLEPERRQGRPILVVGDFNTAHREIDLARPKDNVGTSGFTPGEREALDRWMRAGWIDTFRHFESNGGHYTWWSQRAGVRARNIGWRIDYVLASAAAMRFVRSAFIQSGVLGSDHCPVGVDLDPEILRAP